MDSGPQQLAEEVSILSRVTLPLLPQSQEPWIHHLTIQVPPMTPKGIHGTVDKGKVQTGQTK